LKLQLHVSNHCRGVWAAQSRAATHHHMYSAWVATTREIATDRDGKKGVS
jgi:hypothetical protein